MESDTSPRLKIVGKLATVKSHVKAPSYFTPVHERWIGKTGRVHAVVAGAPRDNPLVKLGFEDGTQIVFFRLADLELHDAPAQHPVRHGKRGSHLPDVQSER